MREVKTILSAKKLSKSYSYYEKEPGLRGSLRNLFHRKRLTKDAVKNLSFDISEGEVAGLIGLNGAGKTTTLKMMAGLTLPTAGTISVLGYRPFDKNREYLKRISMVMGNKSQLWWDLPAMDSFELNKTIYGVPDGEYRETLRRTVEILNVEAQLRVQVRRLSLGERMKMELIASLIHRPKVLFLDEPTIGLDVITQYHIREFLKQYCRDFGTTVILTSHNFNDILSLCDSLILINKGEKIYSDTFEHFKERFLKEKVFVLRLKRNNAEEMIRYLREHGAFSAERFEEDAVKIVADSDSSLDLLKSMSGEFLDELKDINIENISMEDVIRKIYR